jgi:predicted nucleotidyltransferase
MPIEPETSPPSLSADTEAALRDIAASLGLRLLVVFGSLAAGRGNAGSDLDIGVLTDGLPATAVERRVFERALHPRPDVVDLTRCSALLAFMVARTARVVYEAAPGVFASFASLALRRHEDARRFREADRAVIARLLSVRGGSV